MVDRRVRDYIERAIKKGIERDKIKSALVTIGWKEETVEEAFTEIDNKPKPFFERMRERKELRRKMQEEEKKQQEELKKKLEDDIPVHPFQQETKKLSLTEQVDDIAKKLDVLTDAKTAMKDKRVKLSWNIRRQLKSLYKKEEIIVWLMQINGGYYPKVCKINNGFILVNGVPRDIKNYHVFFYLGKFPCVILPEWDLEPLKTYNASGKASAAATIIRMLENRESLIKKSFGGGMMWVWIGLGAIVIGYLIFGGGFK